MFFLICIYRNQTNCVSAPIDKLKREGSSSTLAAVPNSKKLKVIPGARPGISSPSGSGLISIERLGVGQTGVEPWELLVVECDISEVFETIITHITNDNMDKAVSIGNISEIVNSLNNY